MKLSDGVQMYEDEQKGRPWNLAEPTDALAVFAVMLGVVLAVGLILLILQQL